MEFTQEKEKVLAREDHSKKGSVDEEIKPLVALINSNQNYYTTSSCSGRIVLIVKKSDKKFDASWLFVSHNPVEFNEIKKVLENTPKHPVWFKQESCILHVCAKTLEDANKLLGVARLSGFKRSGIISINQRIMIEVTSTESIDTVLADNGKLLVTEDYLKSWLMKQIKRWEGTKRR